MCHVDLFELIAEFNFLNDINVLLIRRIPVSVHEDNCSYLWHETKHRTGTKQTKIRSTFLHSERSICIILIFSYGLISLHMLVEIGQHFSKETQMHIYNVWLTYFFRLASFSSKVRVYVCRWFIKISTSLSLSCTVSYV